MAKICFVISPLGGEVSVTRKRADYVLETYVRPACAQVGFDAVRADHGVGLDIVDGTTSALNNAPMAIAYLGSQPESPSTAYPSTGFWSGNVMTEVGFRLASRLPLLFMCDYTSGGEIPELPLSLNRLAVIGLPCPRPPDPTWIDPDPKPTIDRLVSQLKEANR